MKKLINLNKMNWRQNAKIIISYYEIEGEIVGNK